MAQKAADTACANDIDEMIVDRESFDFYISDLLIVYADFGTGAQHRIHRLPEISAYLIDAEQPRKSCPVTTSCLAPSSAINAPSPMPAPECPSG
jgi:hypothetical protein